MRILMVNKFHYVKGGSETYYFALKSLLEQRGHSVIDFSMADERNLSSPYSAYFVANKDYHGHSGPLRQAVMARDFLYSREAREKLDRLIADTRPDAVHLHLFHHQLSPSILDVIRKRGLPAVYTAHDLQMLCPNYRMAHDGILCEACLQGNAFPCVKNRCVMGSAVKSALSALEFTVHRRRGIYDTIRYWLMPSEFYQRLFLKAGFPEEKIVFIPNFIDLPPADPLKIKEGGEYLLFLGRLTAEKGLGTLLRAVSDTGLPLHIAGEGPMEGELREKVKAEELSGVRLLGRLSGDRLREELEGARAAVLPSEWYENCPYSAIEALRLGRPLVGSRIGGLCEMIGENGFLAEPWNAESLRGALLSMMNAPLTEWRRMSAASLRLFSCRYTADGHWKRLRQVYARMGLSL